MCGVFTATEYVFIQKGRQADYIMQKHRTHIFALILVVPLLLSLLAACGAGSGDTGSSGKILIKIGSDYPTSGDDQSAGLPAQQGAEMAVKEAAAQNYLGDGYELQFDPRDDVGNGGTHDSGVALTNINALIGDSRVAGIVGPLNSSIAQAVMGTANQAPIAMISPANTNDCLTQNTPDYACGGSNSLLPSVRPTGNVTYFRLATPDQYQGHALAEYAYNEKGYRTVFIIDDTETYGKGLATSFEYFWKNTYKGTVIEHRSIAKQDNYDTLLAAIAAKKPDFIFFGGNDSTGADPIRVRMPKISGLENMPFFIGDGSKTITFAKDVIPTGGGLVVGSVPGLDASAIGQKANDFLDKFKQQYGTPGAYSGGSYDSAWILIQAVKKAIDGGVKPPVDAGDNAAAKTFRQAVIDQMKTITYDGITGKHSFDANGDTTNKNISLYTLGDVSVGDGWKYLTSILPKAS
jgi:branched-chain amino acid transport system substrate-binding protein